MIGLLIITHEELGLSYLKLARHFFPLGDSYEAQVLGVRTDDDHESILYRVNKILLQQNWQQGVLILTDIFGATPCNATLKINHTYPIQILTGLNVSMLIKALSHIEQATDLNTLAYEVMQAGIDGIMLLNESV